MDAGTVVAVLGAVAALVAVGWILLHRNDPEDAAGHSDAPVTGSELMFGEANDRPGDPGTESMGVPRPGEPGPSPGRSHPDR